MAGVLGAGRREGFGAFSEVLGVLGVLRVASGRFERPNNRGLWRQWTQTAGCNALIEMPVARVLVASSCEGFEGQA